jgi:hypothetical protein
MPSRPERHDKGQYRFDETLKITVVASEAHENGPRPTQTSMDTMMADQKRAATWGYEPELPHDVTDAKPE